MAYRQLILLYVFVQFNSANKSGELENNSLSRILLKMSRNENDIRDIVVPSGGLLMQIPFYG